MEVIVVHIKWVLKIHINIDTWILTMNTNNII